MKLELLEPKNLRLDSICSVLHRTVTSPWLNLPLLCVWYSGLRLRHAASSRQPGPWGPALSSEKKQLRFIFYLFCFEPNFYIRCLGFKLFIKKILLSKCIKSNDEKLLLKYQYQHSNARWRIIWKKILLCTWQTQSRGCWWLRRILSLTWETIETRPITMLIAFQSNSDSNAILYSLN